MKTFFLFLCVFFPVAFSAAENVSLESILKELDETIKNREIYVLQKEHTLDTLKLELKVAQSPEELYTSYKKLLEAYKRYQTDSALHYVHLEENLLKENPFIGNAEDILMDKVEVLGIMGMYKEAIQILDSIDKHNINNPAQLTNYFHQYRTIYGYMSDFSLTASIKEIYKQKTNLYRDSLLVQLGKTNHFTYILVETDKMIVERKYNEALQKIFNLYEKPEIPYRLKGLLAYNIAEIYRNLEVSDKYMFYLAVSAICDLKLCIREYVALSKLAFSLYEKGDIDRAYKYLQCSMQDAVSCNARLRTIETTAAYPIINQAYTIQEKQSNQIQWGLLIGITIISIFLITAVFILKKQMKELSDIRNALNETNNHLSEANKKLSDSNTTKEQYITYYLEQCTLYLDKLEDYRRSLVKLALASKINDLFKAIKSERFIEEERSKFYKSFDETFLRLYPRFVEQFNELLADGEKIFPKPGELLCTEIRIFALIRIGITDSNKIARFLRYSINTIYIYRSKIRNKAKGDKSLFEQEIMNIKDSEK